MLFFRIMQHLLPTGSAWRVVADKTMRRFLIALASGHESVRNAADDAFDDDDPQRTRLLSDWQSQLGLVPPASVSEQRAQLASELSSAGGQGPDYLQSVVRAAGFDVYLHQWFYYSGLTRLVRNPRDHTVDPMIGTVQAGDPGAIAGEPSAQADRLLANEPGYLVNLDLTRSAPPRVPTDPLRWPHFLYWGGATFGTEASIPTARRAEFERLILKLCPANKWLVTMVNYV